MRRVFKHVSAAAVLAFCALAPTARAQSPTPPTRLYSDAEIDANLFRGIAGVARSGEAMRLFAEVDPDKFAEFRGLIRNFMRARPEDRAEPISELLSFQARQSDRLGLAMRRAPLDALDATLGQVRDALPAIQATDQKLCGFFGVSNDQAVGIELKKVRPDLITNIEIASYRAVAAARERPTTHPVYGEAEYARLREAMKSVGLSDRLIDDFAEERTEALTPAEKCELERGYVAALTSLPDDVRGAVLAYHFSGDDGSSQ